MGVKPQFLKTIGTKDSFNINFGCQSTNYPNKNRAIANIIYIYTIYKGTDKHKYFYPFLYGQIFPFGLINIY